MKSHSTLLRTLRGTVVMAGIAISIQPTASAQQATEPYGLKDCLTYALEHSVDIRKAAFDKQNAQYQIGEVRSSGLPQVKAVGGLETYPSIPTQILPGEILGQPGTTIPVQFGTKFNANGGLEASQVLYNQQLIVGLQSAKSASELYDLMQIKTEEDVIYNVTKAYFGLMQTQQQAEILTSNLDKLEHLEAIMKAQLDNELINKTDYQRIRVSITNLKTQQASIVTALDQQQNYMKLLMGMPINEQITLEYIDLEGFQLAAPAALNGFNPAALTDLQLLEKQRALSVMEMKSFKAGYYPTLAAFGRYSYQAQRNEFNFLDGDEPWFNIAVVGLQLNVPIFDGLQKHYQVQQSRIKLQKVEADMANAESLLQLEHNNANNQLSSSRSNIALQSENVDLAEEVYAQTNLLYEEGVANLSELLDAETALREAKTNYNTEIIKYKLAELDLIKAQGQLKTTLI